MSRKCNGCAVVSVTSARSVTISSASSTGSSDPPDSVRLSDVREDASTGQPTPATHHACRDVHKPFGHVGLAVVHRSFAEVHVEPVSEVFEQPNAFRVDAGGWQVDDFGDTVFAVGAGASMSVRFTSRARARLADSDAVHHFAYAEASGARARSSMPTRTITLAFAAIPASATGLSQSRSISSISSGMECVWNLLTAEALFSALSKFVSCSCSYCALTSSGLTCGLVGGFSKFPSISLCGHRRTTMRTFPVFP